MKKNNIPLGFEDIENEFSKLPDWPNEEVPESLDARFEHFLSPKITKKNIQWGRVMKYAASIVLILVAYFLGKNHPPVVVYKTIAGKTKEIRTTIRDTIFIKPDLAIVEPIKKVKRTVQSKPELLDLINESSASLRLKGINKLSNNQNEEVLDLLIFMLDNDPNENVRMAAAENIWRFGNIAKARTAMVESLMKQNDNSVQYAVLQTLTKWREKQAIPAIKLLRNYDNIDSEYKNVLDHSMDIIITSN